MSSVRGDLGYLIGSREEADYVRNIFCLLNLQVINQLQTGVYFYAQTMAIFSGLVTHE